MKYKFYLFDLILMFLTGLLAYFLEKFNVIFSDELSINSKYDKSFFTNLVLLCIVVPIIEELIFRSWCGKNLKYGFFLLVAILITGFFYPIIVLSFVFINGILILENSNFLPNSFKRITSLIQYTSTHARCFYSSFFFGLMHIAILKSAEISVGTELVIFTSTFCLGILLCIMRLRYNLLESMKLHSFHNLTLILGYHLLEYIESSIR